MSDTTHHCVACLGLVDERANLSRALDTIYGERDEAVAHLRAVLGEAEALERLLGTDGSSHSFTLEDARSFLASLDDEDGGS